MTSLWQEQGSEKQHQHQKPGHSTKCLLLLVVKVKPFVFPLWRLPTGKIENRAGSALRDWFVDPGAKQDKDFKSSTTAAAL